MSELSKALGAAGAPHRIVHEGRTFTFHLLNKTRQNALEKRLYENARQAVYVDREHMSSDEYLKRLDGVREAYENNEYAFFGPRSARILQTNNGALLLLEFVTDESQDDLIPLIAARGQEVNTLIKTVMSESFRGQRPDPPAEAPGG